MATMRPLVDTNLLDPFLAPASSRKPLTYFNPNVPSSSNATLTPACASTSFSQSRQMKTGRSVIPPTPVEKASSGSSSSTWFSLPPPASFVGTSSIAFAYPLGCAPTTPSGTPQSPSALLRLDNPLSPLLMDVDMKDVHATPPPTARTLLALQSSMRGSPTPMSPPPSACGKPLRGVGLVKKSTHASSAPYPSVLTPVSMTEQRLDCPVAPLTPPLTPPYSSSYPRLPPAAQIPSISSSLSQGAPSAATTPLTPPTSQPQAPHKTLSGRLLANYHLHPLFAREYTIREELGSGGFGFVVRAVRNENGQGVAVKFIERVKIPDHGWVSTTSFGDIRGLKDQVNGRRKIPMEAYVLRGVRSEGVVGFIDLFEDDKYFYLVMEHHGSPWEASAGPDATHAGNANNTSPATVLVNHVSNFLGSSPESSPIMLSSSLPASTSLSPPRPVPMERRSSCDLFECIEQHSRFDEYTAKYVFAQIVETVYELSRMGICHRDIKDENIVVSKDFRVKLIDFGSAVIFDPSKPAPFYNRFFGTTSFASAEILRGEPYQAPSSEIWSLGVLLSILVTGECPFADPAAASVGRRSRPKVRLGIEVEWLLRRCLEVDVTKRITIEEIRNSKWLRGVMRRK